MSLQEVFTVTLFHHPGIHSCHVWTISSPGRCHSMWGCSADYLSL